MRVPDQPRAIRAFDQSDLPARASISTESLSLEIGGARLDWLSFACGLAVALLWTFLRTRKGRWSLLARVAVVALLVTGLAGTYFGGLHRIAGGSSGTLVGPMQIVDDARDTARQVEANAAAHEQALDALAPEPGKRKKSPGF